MRYPKPYYDACTLQDKVMEVAANPPPRELANLCKAYATLEGLKLRIRMKPAPKPVDTEKLAAAKVRSNGRPTMVSE